MEVTVVSRDTIKPSLNSVGNKNPHKLCLFDQITPLTYIIGVLFYPISDPNFDANKTLTHLRKCLSRTLEVYYPFSGRNTADNLHVADFHAGVPFIEARADRRMSEFLKLKDADSLNCLVPFAPFRRETAGLDYAPLFAVQATVFACGGLAFGASSCHKNADGTTSCFLIQSWAALCRESPERVIVPNFSDAAAMFPPATTGVPEKYSSLMDRLWFSEGEFATRRFVFGAGAVEALRAKGSSERVPRPSRNDAVSCFIWKHATEASWALKGSRRMSFAGPAVNVRSRMASPSAARSVGNLFWWGMAVVNPNDGDEENEEDEDGKGKSSTSTSTGSAAVGSGEFELSTYVGQMKEAMEGFENDFLREVKEGREGSSEIVSQLEILLAIEQEDPYIIGFTNWRGFFNDVDFGFGKPFWIGAMGKVGPAFRNLVILVESQSGQGIEAFIALKADEMAVLEKDPRFLAFASPNPGFSSL